MRRFTTATHIPPAANTAPAIQRRVSSSVCSVGRYGSASRREARKRSATSATSAAVAGLSCAEIIDRLFPHLPCHPCRSVLLCLPADRQYPAADGRRRFNAGVLSV